MEVTVRITQTYHRVVTAEFGDTDEDLLARGLAALAEDPEAVPDANTAVLLPEDTVI